MKIYVYIIFKFKCLNLFSTFFLVVGQNFYPVISALIKKSFVLSKGAGRTGVFLTLSIVLERIRYEGMIDVFQTVKLLRTQRPALVQTEV